MTFFIRKIMSVAGFLSLGFAVNQTQAAICTYKIDSEWNTGFTASITITNNGSSTINGWNVGWKFNGNAMTSGWNATFSGTNPYTAKGVDWNSSVQPGQSVSFGFQADKNGGLAEKPVVTGAICGAPATSSIAPSSKAAASVPASIKASIQASSAINSFWTTCANENQTCSFSGTKRVRYGAGTTWNEGIYTTSVNCNNATFGDPIPGTFKTCQLASTSVPASSKPKSSSPASSKKSSAAASSVGPVTLKGVANFPIGAALSIWGSNNIYTSTQEQGTLLKHFDAMVAENIMKPQFLHPQENTFFWADGDKLVQFAKDHGMQMHAHTLIWHNGAPAYFDNYKNNAAGMKAVLKTHVDTIARHFAGKVESWDVVNEALDDGAGINGYRNSVFFQAMGSSFIDEAFKNARIADSNALLYYNDYNIESNAKYNNMIAMLKGMQSRNIPIDGVGFQMHVGLERPSIQNIEDAFQGVVNLGLKIRLSELDVSLNAHWDNRPATYTSLTPELSAKQKERYRQIVAAYKKIVPSCLRTGITVWNISDNFSWLNNITEEPSGIKDPDWPVLFDANYNTKPAFDGFIAGLRDASINNNERYCP